MFIDNSRISRILGYTLFPIACSLFLCCATYYTPQQFGAVADGDKDCTQAIRTMLETMKKDNVYKAKFLPGEYKISDRIIIDFPCSLKGDNATIITKDTLKARFAFYYSKRFSKDKTPNKKRTELSLNFKIHGEPIGIFNYNGIDVHDCVISTFTGSDIYWKNTSFWFAIHCLDMYDATFKNIFFDQPANYKENQFNSADGLHIQANCHDIIVDGCYGHCGDDFIALNASEAGPGDIYNIKIRNCNIGSDTISKNGIRIYGMEKDEQITISNILIENCRINSLNSPCIYITNSENGVIREGYQKVRVENLTVKNCIFNCPQYELASGDYPSAIRIAGVEGYNIVFKNIEATANSHKLSYFLNVMDYNDLQDVVVKNCSLQGMNAHKFLNVKDGIQINGLKEKRNKLIR